MKAYLTDRVEWQRVVQRTGYGEPITENRPIMVRYEERLKRIVTSTGADAVSTAKILCVDEVHVGDIIKKGSVSREVLSIQIVPTLDGVAVLREAFL